VTGPAFAARPSVILGGMDPGRGSTGTVDLRALTVRDEVIRNAAARCTRYPIAGWPVELDGDAAIVSAYDTRWGREAVFRPPGADWLVVMQVVYEGGRVRYFGGSVQRKHLAAAYREVTGDDCW